MGAGVFPLYLIPLNTAQKLTYALFFLLAQQQASSSRGMTIFCALLCLYRMGLMLEKGGNVKSIAEQLVISQGTAKAHVRNIYAKLGVHSKEEAVAELIQARKEFFG